jgi:hypothetical protein
VVHEVREDAAMLLVRLAWPEAVRWRQRRAVELAAAVVAKTVNATVNLGIYRERWR